MKTFRESGEIYKNIIELINNIQKDFEGKIGSQSAPREGVLFRIAVNNIANKIAQQIFKLARLQVIHYKYDITGDLLNKIHTIVYKPGKYFVNITVDDFYHSESEIYLSSYSYTRLQEYIFKLVVHKLETSRD